MTDRIFLLLSFAGCTFGARAADGHHDVRRAPRLRAYENWNLRSAI